MTQEEKIKDFIEYWGEKLVDPNRYPKIFDYQLRLWKYYRKITD